ncbi:MAG: c-type cytochrome [Candidatus Bipolaricaulia bacterium]
MRRWEIAGAILVILILVGLPAAVFSYQFSREAHSPEASPRISRLEGDPAAGGEVFREHCASCHGERGEGGFGPDLRSAGLLGAAYLYQIILDPHNGIVLIGHPPRMPELELSKRELADVVAYLLSIKDPEAVNQRAEEALAKLGVASSAGEEGGEEETIDLGQGRTLYISKGCAACHGADGRGTAAGPSIIGRKAEEIRYQVREPRGTMPSFGPERLSDDELEAIIRYLESLGEGGEQ